MRAWFAADGVVTTEINNRTVKVVGLLEIGPSFGIDGTIMTSIDNWLRLFPERPRDEIQLGLIRLRPGADAVVARDRLRDRAAPRRAGTDQSGLRRSRTAYRNGATPIGFMFAFGAIMGLVVGMMIVYQILFADISGHLNEYATLQAMGYRNRFVSGIVLQQAAILSVPGFIPGAAASAFLYISRQAPRGCRCT